MALKNKLRWLNKHPWILSIFFALIITIPGFILVERNDQRIDNVVLCINDWAELTGERSQALSKLSSARNDVLDKMIRAVAKQDRKNFSKYLAQYVIVSDKLNKSQRENPVPTSPRLVCEEKGEIK